MVEVEPGKVETPWAKRCPAGVGCRVASRIWKLDSRPHQVSRWMSVEDIYGRDSEYQWRVILRLKSIAGGLVVVVAVVIGRVFGQAIT